MKNQILFSENGSGYKMTFLNGEINVPKNYGAYVIASGCGSGKTTIIKQIIKNKLNDGIAIFCKTIEECNNLWDYYVREVSGQVIINDPYKGTRLCDTSDALNMCSEPRLERTANDKLVCTNGVDLKWKDNLSILGTKRLLIATHAVLMTVSIKELTLISYVPASIVDDITAGMYGLTGKVTQMRQFMLVDEIPLNNPLTKTYTRAEFELLGMMKLVTNITPNFNTPNSVNVDDKMYLTRYEPYSLFKKLYDSKRPYVPNFVVSRSDTELGELKENMIISALYLKYNDLSEQLSRGEIENVRIKYNLPLLMLPGMRTRFWIFDGTGDITLFGSKTYLLMSFKDKYQDENVNMIKIPHYLPSRTVDVDKLFRNKQGVMECLDKNVKLLKSIIDNNNETLIIVWKNLRSKYINESGTYGTNLTKFVLNDEFNLPEYYRFRLESLGIPPGKFHIIHYGSGRDLATNEFRNCDAIVRLGKFSIPNDALSDLNEDIGANMKMRDFILYQNIQALSRTHIRFHEGRKVKFYVSSDFDDYTITDTYNYLTNEGCRTEILDRSMSGIDKRLMNKLDILFDTYPVLFNTVINGDKLEVELNIDDLFNLIPINKKQVRGYMILIEALKSLGIKMSIITNSPNKGVSKEL